MNNKILNRIFISFISILLLTGMCHIMPDFAVHGEEAEPAGLANPYSFDRSSKTLYVGWKSYLSDINGIGETAEIVYRSDDEEIATISEEGEIFPVSAGKTTVYADITENDNSYTCSMAVTVRNPYSKAAESTDVMTLNSSLTFGIKRYGHEEPVFWELKGEPLAVIEAVTPTECTIKAYAAGYITLVAQCGEDSFSFNVKIYNGEGELFILTPDSEPYNGNYVKYGTYNKKTKGYYLLRSYLERLNTLKGGVLVLTKGTYTVTNTLCIPSNTTIILEDGAVIKKSDDTGTKSLTATASLFQTVSFTNAAKEGVFSKYNGEHDIKILGEGKACIDMNSVVCQGVISCHCNRLTISGITFKNMNTYHFIELDASKDVTISNNYFFGSTESTTSRKEAINLDTPDTVTNGFHQYWTSYDKTPDKNIYITDNVFCNVECGVGTHKYTYDSPHENVNILRNTFIDCNTYAIRCMNWDKPVIKDNGFIYSVTPENSEISIIVNGAVNPLITENRFENITTPVSFYHWRNTGYGKEYDPIYNNLDSDYATALTKNYLVNVTNHYYEFYPILDDFEEENLKTYAIDAYDE